jgi:branched-chain amino acid transport system permease protein
METTMTQPDQYANSRIGKAIAWSDLISIFAAVFVLLIISLFVDAYLAYVATSWVIFGIVGLSLDLVWGRAGVLSLSQTAFYGLGGYAGSIAAINFSYLTGNTLIWSLPVGMLVGGVVAAFISWIIFYGRMGVLQTTILTYTFTLVLWTATVSFSTKVGRAVVGGDNGMSNIPPMILGLGDTAKQLEPNAMLVTVVVIAAILYALCKALAKSPFGLVIDCIRLDPVKVELLGYDIRRYQLILFTIAGGIAGLAGSLFAAWSNYLNPSIFSVQEALLIPIYVLVGGRGTLVGAFVGALAVGGLSFWLGGGVIGGQTTLVMGVCLILLVLFMKSGLLGGLAQLVALLRSKRESPQAPADQAEQRVKIDFDLLDKIRLQANTNSASVELSSIDAMKSFGGVTPVNRVTQSFKKGKVRCIIGPNGAGKSSYLKALAGTYRLDAGQIKFGQRDITHADPFDRVCQGLGIKMQKAQVFDDLDVRTNLWIAAYSRDRDRDEADRVSEGMLKMLGMDAQGFKPAIQLSHGEQQWLDIGMVLCLSPDVMLFDEPAAGMTKDERRQLSQLIKTLSRSAAVVVVEHDMDFVRTLDADVTVLHQGEVFAQGDIEVLRKDERILDIYLGRRKHVQAR